MCNVPIRFASRGNGLNFKVSVTSFPESFDARNYVILFHYIYSNFKRVMMISDLIMNQVLCDVV